MLESFASIAIGSIIYVLCMQHMLHTLKIYTNIQHKFRSQQSKLIAQHYIINDLSRKPLNIFFYTDEQVLHLQYLDHAVQYFIRRNELFRDDMEHNAVALVKDVRHIQAEFYALAIDQHKIIITVFFNNNETLEVPCILNTGRLTA